MARAEYARVWRSSVKKAVRVHRLAATAILGRDPLPSEVVHHKNGDKFDNRLENLVVLPSQRHHMILEHQVRRERLGIVPLFDWDDVLEMLEPPSAAAVNLEKTVGDDDLVCRWGGELVGLFPEGES